MYIPHIHKKHIYLIILRAVMLASCAPTTHTTIPSVSQPVPIQPKTFKPTGDILIPKMTPFEPPIDMTRTQVIHEVAPLESLWRISKMYDVSQNTILQANNLSSAQALKVGQKLTIPNAAPITSFIPLYQNTRWKYIIVHHTASDIGNARLVDIWHHKRGFWHGLGYHFLIDNGTVGKQDGQLEISPRWIKQQRGAHCKACNMNDISIGISLVGNFSKNQPSAKQMESLVFTIKELMEYYNIPASHVIKHRDVLGANTECPGLKFPWDELKRKIK